MNDQAKSRNIVVRALRAIWRGLDSIRKVTHLFLMLFVLMAFIGALSGSAPSVPKSAVLSIQPTGVLVEELAGRSLESIYLSPAARALLESAAAALNHPGVVRVWDFGIEGAPNLDQEFRIRQSSGRG